MNAKRCHRQLYWKVADSAVIFEDGAVGGKLVAGFARLETMTSRERNTCNAVRSRTAKIHYRFFHTRKRESGSK